MSHLLYITPVGKANKHTCSDTSLTLYSLRIELRAWLISKQLAFISRLRPKKFRNHVINHSYWIRLLRRSIRKHQKSLNRLRLRLAKESGLATPSDNVRVIRTTRQDGDTLVPIFLLDTSPSSEYSDRTEPYSSEDGFIANHESSEGRPGVHGEQRA